MPKITIEKQIKITENVSEIRTSTYSIPQNIVVDGKTLYYDNYHKAYVGRDNSSISAEDYLKCEISKSKKNNPEK